MSGRRLIHLDSCYFMLVVIISCFSVWDSEEGTKLVSQYNSPARITAAEFLNPHDISFLLTGSGDGASSCLISGITFTCMPSYMQMMVLFMCGGTMILSNLPLSLHGELLLTCFQLLKVIITVPTLSLVTSAFID